MKNYFVTVCWAFPTLMLTCVILGYIITPVEATTPINIVTMAHSTFTTATWADLNDPQRKNLSYLKVDRWRLVGKELQKKGVAINQMILLGATQPEIDAMIIRWDASVTSLAASAQNGPIPDDMIEGEGEGA